MDEKERFNGFDDDMDVLDPEDFEETEEESEKEVEEEAKDGNEVETDTDDNAEKTEVKTDEETEEQAKAQEETESEKQKKADELHKRNEEQKQKRLKREAEEREKLEREARLKGKLEVLSINPYTNEKIVDEDDLEIYEIQKQLDKEGLDPINDLGKRIAENNRKAKQAAAEKAKEEEEFNKLYEIDKEQFKKAYPDVSLDDLEDDEDYNEFAKNKVGRWTLKEIYEAYTAKKEKSSAKEKEAMIKEKAKDISKKVTSTPSSSGSNNRAEKGFLEMTDEEYIKLQKEQSGDFF